MQAKAIAKHIRISPRKARQVIDLIRGKKVQEALAILKFTPHKATESVSKVLKSAVANAEHNYEMDADKLYVKEAYVDAGPSLKRVMPRAMGRADIINSHFRHLIHPPFPANPKPSPNS
jgi:large subunit ribosomal protein L22